MSASMVPDAQASSQTSQRMLVEPEPGSPSSGKDFQSVLELVTNNLLKLGAIPLERFATEDNPEEEGVDPNDDGNKALSGAVNPQFQAIAKVYEACLKAFGNADATHFEHVQELGPKSRECILTITRPNGAKRSYTSGPYFSKKSEAKAAAASLALQMRALEFIQYGDTDSKGRTQLVIEPPDAQPKPKVEDGKGVSYADHNETVVDDPNVQEIEKCCVEWRASTVKPIYMHFSEPTLITRPKNSKSKKATGPTEEDLLGLKQGCALKIELSKHSSRVYSVHHTYSSRAAAKSAVAAVAIKQGVLDFIKYGNGQTEPMVFINELDGDANENLNRDVIEETNGKLKEVTIEASAVNVTLKRHQIPLNVTTLQSFTDTLPKPFPETAGLRPLGDGNAVGWLNTAVQSARGSKMSMTWTFLSNAKLSLHGCLVRFNLPRLEDGRTYLVEPEFAKRGDAKSAVALLAISQNVGGYIKSVTDAVENLITAEMRTQATSLLQPLDSECNRAGIQGQPFYAYEHEEGAVGCTLRIEFSPTLSRSYTVPVQYRTKPDARLAAVLQAHHEGIIEFIRFRGGDPPPGYSADSAFDWKMAKKIEDAKARGVDLLAMKQLEDDDTSKRRSQVSNRPMRNNSINNRWNNTVGVPRIMNPPIRLGFDPPMMPPAFPQQHSPPILSPYPPPEFAGYHQPHAEPPFIPPPLPPRHLHMGPPAPPQHWGGEPIHMPYSERGYPLQPPPPHHPHMMLLPPVPVPFERPPYHYPRPHSPEDYPPPSHHHHHRHHSPPTHFRRSPDHEPEPEFERFERYSPPPMLRPRMMAEDSIPAYTGDEDDSSGSVASGEDGELEAGEIPSSPRPRRRRSKERGGNWREDLKEEEQSTLDYIKEESPGAQPLASTSREESRNPDSRKRRRSDSPEQFKPAPQQGKYTAMLLAHAARTGSKPPQFKHIEVKPGQYKVWIIMNNEKMELPGLHDTVDAGIEKVAKQVLIRIRTLAKKPKVEPYASTGK